MRDDSWSPQGEQKWRKPSLLVGLLASYLVGLGVLMYSLWSLDQIRKGQTERCSSDFCYETWLDFYQSIIFGGLALTVIMGVGTAISMMSRHLFTDK